MDMQSAEKVADKLLTFVQSVAMSDSKLYGKSKQRLQSIANVCSQVVTAVSGILQTEILESDQQEFESKPDVDIYEQVASLSAEIEKLKEFIQFPDSSNCDPVVNNDLVEDDSVAESSDSDIDVMSSNDNVSENIDDAKLSPDEMKSIVSKYGCVLKNAANTDCGIPAGNQVTSILWRWFQARIFTKYSNAPPFHYSVHRFKSIIYSFIVLYGKHFEDGTVELFLRYFEDWISSLSTSHESNKWIAPYDVYQIERAVDTNHANLTAVVLYDVLMDTVLKPLLDKKSDGYYLCDSGIYDMVYSSNSSCLDNYTNYKYDPSILESLKLM